MRTVLYGAATSLDGYIARPNGAVDWLHWSDDVAAITAAYWTTVDTIVMGRKTYDIARASNTATTAGKQTYVYSRTLTPRVEAGLAIIGEDAVAHVGQLKRAHGGGICVMGGGELARDLLDAGLVDEVGINLHPVLLGAGIPMFHRMARQIDLRLIETKPLKHGCIYALYGVVPRRRKRVPRSAQSN